MGRLVRLSDSGTAPTTPYQKEMVTDYDSSEQISDRLKKKSPKTDIMMKKNNHRFHRISEKVINGPVEGRNESPTELMLPLFSFVSGVRSICTA